MATSRTTTGLPPVTSAERWQPAILETPVSSSRSMAWCCIVCLSLSIANAWAARPQRIITLAPNLAELVCAAGGCNRLVGVSAYTDFPPEAADIPRIGNAYAVDLEAIVADRPDLILAWKGGTSLKTIARLRQLGLRVVAPRIRGLSGIATALRRIGRLLGTRTTADRAAARFMRHLGALRRRYAGMQPLRVFYQIGVNPAYTVNRKSNVSAVLKICGGRNVFANLSAISGPVSAEAVLARAPQVVLYGNRESRASIKAYWKQLPAVPAERFHAIYSVDSDLVSRASPRVLKGIRQVCQRLMDARAAYSSDQPFHKPRRPNGTPLMADGGGAR